MEALEEGEPEVSPNVTVHNKDFMYSIPNFCDIYKGCWDVNGLVCTIKENYKDDELLNREEEQIDYLRQNVHSNCHPNLVMHLCLSKEDGLRLGIVTELLSCTLRGFLHNRKALRAILPLDFKRSILIDIVLAMRYLHSQGIAHRNLNPYNIFLTRCLRVKVGNFYAAGPGKVQVGVIADIEIKYNAGEEQESNKHFLPTTFEDESGETIDYFGFGCVILFTLAHEWPTPIIQYTSDNVRNHYEQRYAIVKDIEQENLGTEFLPVVESCLANEASNRQDFQWIHEKLTEKEFDPRFKQDSEYFTSTIMDYGLTVNTKSYYPTETKPDSVDKSTSTQAHIDVSDTRHNVRKHHSFQDSISTIMTPSLFIIMSIVVLAAVFVKLIWRFMHSNNMIV